MADEERETVTIQSLLDSGAIIGHKDGNHGSLYPRVEEFGSVGVPFLTAKSLSDGKIDIEGAPRLSNDRADTLRLGFVQSGDVLLSHNATVGRVAIVPEFKGRLLIGTSLTYFRVDPSKILPRYLAAYFSGSDFQNQLAAVMSQTTRNQVPITAQRRLRIVLPPLTEQYAIAHILGTLDDKIELNRRMNETLEAIVRAFFKSWFVDFDPVRAKAERRDPGLPKLLADLFPDSFEDSELGEIPKGWKVGKLGEVLCQRVERCAPTAETAARPYVPIDCISSKSLFLTESKPGEEAQSSLTKFYKGDLLFGAMRPYFHKVCIAPFDGTTRTTAFVFYPRKPDDFAFATLLLHHPDTIDFATRHSTGSTIPYAVWTGSLEDMPVVMPPPDVRKAFNRVVQPILVRIPEPHFENRTLAALRDLLLPKLISGELQVNKNDDHQEQRL